MSNPIFTVDRRPAVHISYGVAGGAVDQFWCSTADHCKAVIDPSSGLRRSGVTSTSNIGIQQIINTMAYHYDRGIRRFIINSPCGTVTADGTTFTNTAFSGIWTPNAQKYVIRQNGTRVINPYEGCWPGGVPADPNAAGIDSGAITFVSDGRTVDWYVLLRTWIAGNTSYWPGAVPKTDVEIALYTSFMIPKTSTGTPDNTKNWVKFPTDQANFTWLGANSGYDIPDPANNTAHATFLQNEFHRWYECGICGIGADVGQYAWNHRKGSWVYNDLQYLKAGYNTPKTNMRKWFENDYFGLTQGSSTNQRFSTSTKFTYFQEAMPWDIDPNKITNRSTSHAFPTAGTSEAFALLDPWGSLLDTNSSEYEGSWLHYSPYIVGVANLTTWANGNYANATSSYNGADPNSKWQFDPATTEIHLLANTALCAPFTDATNTTMSNLSSTISAPATQTIIENCVSYWMDFINRGYVYQPILYHNDFLVNRTIHKRIMQELGQWPVTDPAP